MSEQLSRCCQTHRSVGTLNLLLPKMPEVTNEISCQDRVTFLAAPISEFPPRWHQPFANSCVRESPLPVSSRLFRLDRTFGQPLETALMICDCSRSMLCETVNLIVSPSGSSSITQRE